MRVGFWVGLLALSASLSSNAQTQEALVWEESWDAAKAAAAVDGRPVLLFFTFETCYWCNVLKKETLTDPKVIAEARNFHWAAIDNDKTPEISKRFNVSSFPSLLVLGKKDENVHRWSGYRKPEQFLPYLADALRRYALYVKGEEWSTPLGRPAKILDEKDVVSVRAPLDEIGSGLATIGDEVIVAHGNRAFRLDAKTLATKSEFALPVKASDLATDGKVLFVQQYGWTKGDPIVVVDPTDGKTLREIVTVANKSQKYSGAFGLAYLDGKLFASDQECIKRLNPGTGAIEAVLPVPDVRVLGLAEDGANLVAVDDRRLIVFKGTTATIDREVTLNYRVRNLASKDGEWLFMEQPEMGFDKAHKPVRIFPNPMTIHRVR